MYVTIVAIVIEYRLNLIIWFAFTWRSPFMCPSNAGKIKQEMLQLESVLGRYGACRFSHKFSMYEESVSIEVSDKRHAQTCYLIAIRVQLFA